MFTIIFFLFTGSAFAAMPMYCSTSECMHENTIRPPKAEIRPEPTVQVDRYNVEQFKDDGVLVSRGVVRKPDLASGNRNGVELPAKASSEPTITVTMSADTLDTSKLPDQLAKAVRERMK